MTNHPNRGKKRDYRSSSLLGWYTNDPVAAEMMRKADHAYDRAKAAASGLCLAEKVDALRAARRERDHQYALAYVH